MPGCPDIVFVRARIAVFCDGDFWHGRDWGLRKERLGRGKNAGYWVSKIERNIERDAQVRDQLERAGWQVLRFWETEILRNGEGMVGEIEAAIDGID
jgi:DNA mismatch endonuclease, patch repair protein